MSFGYIGDISTKIKQQVKNEGILSVTELLALEKAGHLGGSLELIQSQTVSGVTVIDFTSIKETEYDVMLLQLLDIEHSGQSQTRMQFFESGVLETASVYQYAFEQGESNGNFFDTLKSTGFGSIYITYSNNGDNTGDLETSYIYLYNLGNSSKYSFATIHTIFQDNGVLKLAYGGGLLPQTSVVNGIRLDFQSTNTNGTAKLYGLKKNE